MLKLTCVTNCRAT